MNGPAVDARWVALWAAVHSAYAVRDLAPLLDELGITEDAIELMAAAGFTADDHAIQSAMEIGWALGRHAAAGRVVDPVVLSRDDYLALVAFLAEAADDLGEDAQVLLDGRDRVAEQTFRLGDRYVQVVLRAADLATFNRGEVPGG